MRTFITVVFLTACSGPQSAEQGQADFLRSGVLGSAGQADAVDLLFVVHDGPTMADVQGRLGRAGADLADALEGVDARVYVITTSSPTPVARFTTTEDDFEDAWADAVQVGVDRAALGQGLRTALSALTGGQVAVRGDAFLSLVHVSDEPEESPGEPESYVRGIEGDRPEATALHALVGLPDAPCGEVEVGEGYLEAAEASGGLALDVCAADYGPALARVVEASQ